MRQKVYEDEELNGQKFGRLLLLYRGPKRPGRTVWKCRCDCGVEKLISISNIVRGEQVSCGCYNREIIKDKTHVSPFREKRNKYISKSKLMQAIYAHDHYVKYKKTKKLKAKIRETEMQSKVLTGYGEKCQCCGETTKEFLTIDHVNRDGAKDRYGKFSQLSKLRLFIIRNNFPPEYRILCFNCNCGRERNKGVCPHEKTK